MCGGQGCRWSVGGRLGWMRKRTSLRSRQAEWKLARSFSGVFASQHWWRVGSVAWGGMRSRAGLDVVVALPLNPRPTGTRTGGSQTRPYLGRCGPRSCGGVHSQEDDTHSFMGRRILTVTPCPGPSLATAIVPPCPSTMARVMASPRPVPPIPRLRDWSVR